MSKVFICYSHKDEQIRQRLQTHLEGFAWSESALDVFFDGMIGVGEPLEKEIFNAIEETSVAVLLISADFLASSFIRDKELPALLERHKERSMPIVPIVIDFCAWQNTPLATLMMRPKNARPLSAFGFQEQQKILVEIAREINQIYIRQIDRSDQITIVVADDKEYAVRGLRDLFNDRVAKGMSVVGMARTPTEVERNVVEFVPDILLLDLSWYRNDDMGFRLIDEVQKLSPSTKIIAISNYIDLLEEAQKKNIPTLEKDFTIMALFRKIRDVHESEPANFAQKLLFKSLTDRELEVLSLVAQGFPDKEIKSRLTVSLNTVKKHMRNILAKTGAKSRTEAAVKATEYGII